MSRSMCCLSKLRGELDDFEQVCLELRPLTIRRVLLNSSLDLRQLLLVNLQFRRGIILTRHEGVREASVCLGGCPAASDQAIVVHPAERKEGVRFD